MEDILDIGPLDDRSLCALVEWQRLGSLCEAVSTIYEDAPKLLDGKLKRIRFPISVNEELLSPHVM